MKPKKDDARLTLPALRTRAEDGRPVPMLTCYDYTTARHLAAAGVRAMLVGDSAANVLLGHATTHDVSPEFLATLASGVRRGAPEALLMVDLPFGSTLPTARALKTACAVVQRSGADCVKLETTRGHLGAIQALADAGVAAVAHLGLMPQHVARLGGYKAQGRTADEAIALVELAHDLVNAGASAVLLEATPPEVAELLVQLVAVPVIGCGAGPACHGHVVVLQDLLGLTHQRPRFAPALGGKVAPALREAGQVWVDAVQAGDYPQKEHGFAMPPAERQQLKGMAEQWGLHLGGRDHDLTNHTSTPSPLQETR